MLSFSVVASDHLTFARTGVVTVARGTIRTPVFMPVGTKGALKAMSWADARTLGAEIVLGNTYHLYLRPGHELVERFGGLPDFSGWKGPMLTDSGGFQVFSLGLGKRTKGGKSLVKLSEEGVEFRSVLDGSKHFFSPERVMEIEGSLGADIIMALDECPPHDADMTYLSSSVDRTHRWWDRCLTHFTKVQERRRDEGKVSQTLFPIIQGGIDASLRTHSAKTLASYDVSGFGIGGLSVGESKQDMYAMLEVIDPLLPRNKPRYLMGVGTPEDLLEGIARGVDMFDCVLPTRIGRHGAFFTHDGRKTISNELYKYDGGPLDSDCVCAVCTAGTSRAYLRHLYMEKEIEAFHMISLHNVAFLVALTKKASEMIVAGTFSSWKEDFLLRYFA